MRINAEIFPPEEKEEEGIKALSIQQPQKLVVVGYALTSKKKKSFLQPKLEVLARNKGILFTAIDLNRPLSDQGPFDVVLHKLSRKDWSEVIEVVYSLGKLKNSQFKFTSVITEWRNEHMPGVRVSQDLPFGTNHKFPTCMTHST